jgi:hypothetical protein
MELFHLSLAIVVAAEFVLFVFKPSIGLSFCPTGSTELRIGTPMPRLAFNRCANAEGREREELPAVGLILGDDKPSGIRGRGGGVEDASSSCNKLLKSLSGVSASLPSLRSFK